MPRIGGNQINANRDPTDLYPTHPSCTRALLKNIKLQGPVWEPAAGNGDMVKVIREAGYRVHATDILTGQDFLATAEPWAGSIVTNPPYRLADEFIAHALSLASAQTAMLLPVGALGGQRRFSGLWAKRPPALILVIARRMVVTGSASQFNHMWAVWSTDQDVGTCSDISGVHSRHTAIRWASGDD
jgi:hypothetical protein